MRLTILAVVSAALLTAVAAHVGIDIAGDYLLPDDAYDHVAHGSRELFTVIALCVAAGAGAVLTQRILAAAAHLRTRIRLLRIRRGHAAGVFAAIALLSIGLVPLMETLDALRSGGDVDSLSDAFGGSLLLGGSVTLACAIVVAGMLFALLAWLCRHRDTVARIVDALISPERESPHVRYSVRECTALLACARERRAQRRGKRGPPLRVRSLPVS